MFDVSEPYVPRPTRFVGVREHTGWRLKVYEITCSDEAIDVDAYEDGLPTALDALPAPASSAHRPGAGFLIRHQGRGVHYLVLCWWDRENELPIRVWVRPRDEATAVWRPAGTSESVCVWDLQVIEFERQAYIRHVLGRVGGPDIEGYLRATFDVAVGHSDR